MTKVFFACDMHGSIGVAKKWLHVPKTHGVDVLLYCGDLTGKLIVPLIQQSDGTYTTSYFGPKEVLRNEAEVEAMHGRLANAGAYAFKSTMEEVQKLRDDPKKVDELIKGAIVNRMKQWMELLIERVDTKRVKVVVMPGNDDVFNIDPVIKSYEDKGVIYPLDKVIDIGGFETISYEYVNPTPWNTPREATEKELNKRIEKLVEKLSNPSKSIFNFHCPPINTRLDLAPKLDKKLRIVTLMGVPQFEHVGSRAVREAEEKYKPLLGLHGHIHEAFGFDQIGKTLVINPGSEYGEGMLRGYIIELSKDGVEKYWKVEG